MLLADTLTCEPLFCRLYLAQQNSVDTGAPISPSSCPACQPVQYTPGTDLSSSISSTNLQPSDSASTAQHFTSETADPSHIQEGRTAELQTSYNKRQCPIHDGAYSVQALDVLYRDYKQTGQSALAITNVTPCQKTIFQSPFAACNNHLPQEEAPQNEHMCLQNALPQLVKDSGSCLHGLLNAAQSLSGHIASTKPTTLKCQIHQSPSIDEDVAFSQTLQRQENKNLSSFTHIHENEVSVPVFQQNNCASPTSMTPYSALSKDLTSMTSYSALPKDLTSFEKLCLILSEDQS